jgi:hypothetical protein
MRESLGYTLAGVLKFGVMAASLSVFSANAQSAVSLSGVELTPVSSDEASPNAVDANLVAEGLRARFPCEAEEFFLKRPKLGSDVPATGLVMLACERADMAQFSVMSMEFADAKTARMRFDEMRDTIAGTPSREEFLFKGRQTREFVMHNDRSCAWTRIISDGLRAVILSGERLEGACGPLEAETASFFETLEFSVQ